MQPTFNATAQVLDIDPKQLTIYTVDCFKPKNHPSDPDIYTHTAYTINHRLLGWRSINSDVADKELKKMGKIPYGQKKVYLWALAKNEVTKPV